MADRDCQEGRFQTIIQWTPKHWTPLKQEGLADMNMEDIMKQNLEISGKKLETMSESLIGVALDDFVLK